jgi:plastocyanin
VLAAAAAACLLTAATGCSSSGSGPTGGGSTVSGGPATVTVRNFSFSPGDLTVDVGAKVTWKFEDSVQHNVSADDKTFMSDDLNRGHSYSFTFNKAGSYDYTCTIHPQMHGRVTVR